MEKKAREGSFHVIDSFVIRKRNEYYLIGTLEEGSVQENWFINIPLNKSLSITSRIFQIEDIEMSNSGGTYKLLVIKNDSEFIDLLYALNVGSEWLDITIDGED